MATLTVVEGVVERITFESAESGFRVIKVAVEGRGDRIAVVGTFPRAPLGARVRVRGLLEIDGKHGEQLRAESLVELAPDTLAGLERYLASGVIKGVGPKLAQRVVATFGLDSLRVLDDEPERLGEVEGLGHKRRVALVAAWREQRGTRDLMVFLQSHGASLSLATRIVRRYGTRAMAVVSREPYRLALDVHGVGFKTADRIAASIGIAPTSPERMQAGLMQVIHDASDAGHVWTAQAEIAGRAAQLLGFDGEDAAVRESLARGLDSLVGMGRAVRERGGGGARDGGGRDLGGVLRFAQDDKGGLRFDDTGGPRSHDSGGPRSHDSGGLRFEQGSDGEDRVFAAELHRAEVRLAQRLAEIARSKARPLEGAARAIEAFEMRARVELAPEQRSAVEEAARRQVLVVTGGPGVGKTTIVRAILAVLDHAGVAVRLAAPTGRAAKRMSEATGAEATTLHRLLDFDPKTATFKRDRRRPIEAGAVIVDEASMLDLPTADALAQAVAPGTRLLLVGDVDQLPSVGPGAVLRDVIASRAVACVRLRRIFRQAAQSLIVTNAHRINEGELPIAPPAGAHADFFVIERRDPERARATVLELVTSRIPDRFGLDPVRDIQVLTPMNRGPAGAHALNEALQAALNPPPAPAAGGDPPGAIAGIDPGDAGPTLRGRTFRSGDKVMQTRNDYEKNVYNGDVGLVTSINPASGVVSVRFDERDVTFEAGDLRDLVLAYACTIHKAQGSEYPAVVLPLLTSHFVMLSRSLLYTAVTRGKRLVVLVGDPRAVELAVAGNRAGDRRTRLADRLGGALS